MGGRTTPAGGHAVDNDGARLRDRAAEGLSSREMESRAAVIAPIEREDDQRQDGGRL